MRTLWIAAFSASPSDMILVTRFCQDVPTGIPAYAGAALIIISMACGSSCVLKLIGDIHTFGFFASADSLADYGTSTTSDDAGCAGLLHFLRAGAAAYTQLLDGRTAGPADSECSVRYDLGVNALYQAMAVRLHSRDPPAATRDASSQRLTVASR